MTSKRNAGRRSRAEERAILEAQHEALLCQRVYTTVTELLRDGAPPEGPRPALDAALDGWLANLRRRQRNARSGGKRPWQTST
jgi:hypothetical protein